MIGRAVTERFAAARGDAGLLQAGLWSEGIAGRAYAAAARGLRGRDRALAQTFAGHEREHALVIETLLRALPVPERQLATAADLDALMPGLRHAPRIEVLTALASVEQATIAAYITFGRRIEEPELLRSIAMNMGGAAQHRQALRAALGR